MTKSNIRYYKVNNTCILQGIHIWYLTINFVQQSVDFLIIYIFANTLGLPSQCILNKKHNFITKINKT